VPRARMRMRTDTGVKLRRVWAQRVECASDGSGGATGSPIGKDMGRTAKALPIYYLFCAVTQGMVLVGGRRRQQRGGQILGYRARKTIGRRNATGIQATCGRKVTVSTSLVSNPDITASTALSSGCRRQDSQWCLMIDAPVNSLIEAWWFTPRHQTDAGRSATGRHSEN
jgi:hypothetical protein